MDIDQARQLLGVSSNFSFVEVDEAYATAVEVGGVRRDTAPTEALKIKYQQTLDRLDEAYAVLTSGDAEPTGFVGSPLTQTKMADLPGADPSFTSMGSSGGAAPAFMGLQSGIVLNERYEIVRLIGQGGMGAVYEARDRMKDESIAIKVLLPGLVSSEQAKERFLAEAKISCKLSQRNIINVFDVQQSGPHHFLTMELLEGQTLRERIEVQKVARSEFSVEEVKDIATQVGQALSYAHSHMVHRDLKPENIFLCEDGTVKVMDFGIVRLLTSTELTKTGMALGTAYYMAPEQLTGSKSVDARADQYSLGVILYELLSGQLPMGAVAPIGDIRTDIPKKMAQAIMKAISPKPEERFPALDDFIGALDNKSAMPSMPSIGAGSFSKVKYFGLGIAVIVLIGMAIWINPSPIDTKEDDAPPSLDAAKVAVVSREEKGRIKEVVNVYAPPQSNHASEVDISFSGDSWFEAYSIAGASRTRIAMILMKAGDRWEHSVTAPIELIFGDSSAAKTELDGRLANFMDASPGGPATIQVYNRSKMQQLAAGLTAITLDSGYGTFARIGDKVVVHYTTWIDINGTRKKIDSSIDRGTPFQVHLGSGAVIKGLDLGIVGMREGERRQLTISPNNAYGDRGAGQSIPPNATLVMAVQLLRVGDGK